MTAFLKISDEPPLLAAAFGSRGVDVDCIADSARCNDAVTLAICLLTLASSSARRFDCANQSQTQSQHIRTHKWHSRRLHSQTLFTAASRSAINVCNKQGEAHTLLRPTDLAQAISFNGLQNTPRSAGLLRRVHGV